MVKQTTINDVFKFVRFTGISATKPVDGGDAELLSYKDTALSRRIRSAGSGEMRAELARQFLRTDPGVVGKPQDLPQVRDVVAALHGTLTKHHASVRDFLDHAKSIGAPLGDNRAVEPALVRLSDTLLALGLAEPSTERYQEVKVAYVALLLSSGLRLTAGQLRLPLISLLHLPLRELLGFFPRILPKSPPPWGRNAVITSVGVADLMVVKQHILRYEATEIAHIENVMAKESRRREHRFLERVEETITLDREVTDTKEHELSTGLRFELNKETAQTIREDQKYGFDVSVSAKYGPTVEVRSNFAFDSSESHESSAKSSTNYAKTVTDRSLERIQERVREERVRKLIRETEETNHHDFTNDGSEHIVGIYQFVDKIYQAQVFNYGKREMFDFFVPEPASLLWYLEKQPQTASDAPQFPKPPTVLSVRPNDLSATPSSSPDKVFYAELVSQYGASGVQALKPQLVTVSARQVYPTPTDTGPSVGAANDPGAPRFIAELKLKIPDGYRPESGQLAVVASSDAPDAINVHYTFERTSGQWTGREAASLLHPNIRRGTVAVELAGFNGYPADDQGTMLVSVLIWDASQWSVTAQVTCRLLESEVEKWQLATYDTLQSAYFDRLKEWQNEVDRIKAEADAANQGKTPAGTPPNVRQNTIVTELKKHCISILSGYWYDDPSVMVGNVGSSPSFDLERTENYGRAVRFFEHAFEWNQMQFAFYPYYWATKDTWQERLNRSDPDYQYLQFLQAGAARVLLSVRPGFELAVSWYLERHTIAEGDLTSDSLAEGPYLSIVNQIKEQSGEELDAPIPIGEPWEVRIPTNLIYLKRDSTLPTWRKLDGTDWEWQPTEGG